MSIEISRASLEHSPTPARYFLYFKAHKVAKSFFLQHPLLAAVSTLMIIWILKKSGIDLSDLKSLGAKLLQVHKRLNAVVVEFKNHLTEDQINWIKEKLNVQIEQVKIFKACMDVAPVLTKVTSVKAAQGLSGLGIKVAVIDSGINDKHPDLKCRVVARKDFAFPPTPFRLDPVGHGTHCAGVIAGNGEKYTGVAPKALLIDVRVLNSSGSGSTDAIIRGMSWAASQGADIISMSLGGSGTPDDAISREADALASEGIVVVVAAGNEGPGLNTIGSPGCAAKVITVGATDKQIQVTGYSSRGPVIDSKGKNLYKPDIMAPGGGVTRIGPCAYAPGIISTKSANTVTGKCTVTDHSKLYEKMSGTSMATPHVVGICALMLEASKLPKSRTNRCELIKSAIKISATKLNSNYNNSGAGFINAEAAIAEIKKVQSNV
jgi:subtilisin family serine protease